MISMINLVKIHNFIQTPKKNYVLLKIILLSTLLTIRYIVLSIIIMTYITSPLFIHLIIKISFLLTTFI